MRSTPTRRHFLKTTAAVAAQAALAPSLARAAARGAVAAPADTLWATFQAPPTEARASTYWWWKGKLAPGEMRRQLRVLKAAGLGGAHIIPWGSTPAYLSEPWLALLREAAEAAREEGMLLDLSANASWPFRGPWVPLEESLHKVEVTVHAVEGPTTFTPPVAPPPAATKAGKAKGAATGDAASRLLLAQLAPEPLTRLEEAIDVTAVLAEKSSAGLAIPAGRHTVRLVRLVSGLKRSADLGHVPDHFNPQAIENYLRGFGARVAPALGGRLSNGFRALYCDSIEISEANWTPTLPEQFRRRFGYDLLPYLPHVLAVEAGARPPRRSRDAFARTVARVRHDYCRLLADLFLDALGRTFARWCHEHGTLCRWQAYGWPAFYGIEDGYRIPDMPEGNSWLFSPPVFDFDTDVHGWPMWQKYTSSGAHQAGRRIASTEAMTVVEGKFKETLDQVKRQDDFNFICGINHSFLHGFCYSPAGEPFPGRNQYGTYFSEQNTWWPYFRRWMDYNARLSGLFQAARPVAQVAMLFRTSDTWAQAGLHRHPFQMDPPWAHQVWRWLNQSGAHADYVSDQVLQQATFEQGRIAFGPMAYDALLVLGAETLEPATAEALDRYARAGGRIVFLGSVPEASPGLRDAETNDRRVRALCQHLLADHPARVLRRDPPGAGPVNDATSWTEVMQQWRARANPAACVAWADRLLAELGVRRSVRFDAPVPGLYHLHRRSDGKRDLYFFANNTEADLVARASFPGAGPRLERWDPETTTRHPYPVDRDGRALVALAPGESLLLVAGEGEPQLVAALVPPAPRTVRQEIAGPWSVDFAPAKGAGFAMASFELAGLHRSPEARVHRFAGRATYRRSFAWSGRAGEAVRLDLGEAPNCLTEVRLNGRALGVRWYGRHHYDASAALRAGRNELEVTVVTTLFNAVRAEKNPPEPSGLLGPVTLQTRAGG